MSSLLGPEPRPCLLPPIGSERAARLAARNSLNLNLTEHERTFGLIHGSLRMNTNFAHSTAGNDLNAARGGQDANLSLSGDVQTVFVQLMNAQENTRKMAQKIDKLLPTKRQRQEFAQQMLTEQLQSEKTLQMYLETKFQKISLQQRQWSSYFSQPSPVMQEQATPSTVDSSHHIPYHYHQQQQQPQPIWQSNLEQTNLEEQTSGHFTTDWPSIRVAPVAAKNRHTNQIWNVPLPHYQPEARPQPGVRAQPPTCTGINTVKPNTLSVGNGLLFMRNALFKSMANYDVPGAGLNQGYGVGLNDWNYNRSPLEGQQQQQQYQYYLQQQQMFQQQQQQLIQQQIQHRHYLQMQQYRHQQQQQQQLYQQQQQQEQHYRDMYNYNNNNNHHSDFQSNLESNYIEPTSSGHSSNQNSNLNQTINENQIMCNNSNNGTEVPENIRGILRLHSLEMDF